MKEPIDAVEPIPVELNDHVLDVMSAYSAACDLRAFTGPVSSQRLRTMLTHAGLDPQWLHGERWEALETLWRARATPAEASAVFARFSS